jgi:hypothetical protein
MTSEAALRVAQAAAEHARRLLLFPSAANLDRSRALLEQAYGSIEALRRTCGEAPRARKPELRAGLAVFDRTLRRVAALLEGAARFRAGWFQALTAATSTGYNNQGQPSQASTLRSLSVEG